MGPESVAPELIFIIDSHPQLAPLSNFDATAWSQHNEVIMRVMRIDVVCEIDASDSTDILDVGKHVAVMHQSVLHPNQTCILTHHWQSRGPAKIKGVAFNLNAQVSRLSR